MDVKVASQKGGDQGAQLPKDFGQVFEGSFRESQGNWSKHSFDHNYDLTIIMSYRELKRNLTFQQCTSLVLGAVMIKNE